MKIFVSYRRSDAAAHAGRLSDRLAAHFGSGSVFRDIDDISPGTSFRDAIEAEISLCDVFLTLIGPRWLFATDEKGNRKIDNPEDFVRMEIEVALRAGKTIVPILVDGTLFPPQSELPESIREIANYQGIALPRDPEYSRAVGRLIIDLEKTVRTGDIELTESNSKPISFFVSHATADRNWVEKEVVQQIRNAKATPWYSKYSIDSAATWEREILTGLESCDWFVLVVSPRSAESEWVKDELNWAIYNRATRILPVVMERSNLWDFHIRLPRIQSIDFTVDTVAARKALLDKFQRASQVSE